MTGPAFSHVVLRGPLSPTAEAFWAAALGGHWGPADPGLPWDVDLVPSDGDAYLHRSESPDGPALVLEVDDLARAGRRAGSLGASPQPDGTWTSPGGLPFGLLPARLHRRAPARRWPDGSTSRLVQACLDCPSAAAEAEARFWAGLTGWRWQPTRSPEFVCHLVPAGGSLQLLVQRRESTEPRPVSAHLDLGTSDREAEAARLVALGAARRYTGAGWVMLTDPDGRSFCATGQPPEAP